MGWLLCFFDGVFEWDDGDGGVAAFLCGLLVVDVACLVEVVEAIVIGVFGSYFGDVHDAGAGDAECLFEP